MQVEQDAAALGRAGLLAPALLRHRPPPLPPHLVAERRAHEAVGHDPRDRGLLGVVAPVLEDGERHPGCRGVPHDVGRRLRRRPPAACRRRRPARHPRPRAPARRARRSGSRAPRGRRPATASSSSRPGTTCTPGRSCPGGGGPLGVARRHRHHLAARLGEEGGVDVPPGEPVPGQRDACHARQPRTARLRARRVGDRAGISAGAGVPESPGIRTARRVPVSVEPARPPHPPADVVGRRGHEQRAHDEGVEQHAEGDDERDLHEEDQRQHRQGREGRRENDARAGDDPAGHGQADEDAGSGPAHLGLLAHPGHEEDRVVDAQRDEEHEPVERRSTGSLLLKPKTCWKTRAEMPIVAANDTTLAATRSNGATIERSSRASTTKMTSRIVGTMTLQVARARLVHVEVGRGVAADERVGAHGVEVGPQPLHGVLGLLAVGRRLGRGLDEDVAVDDLRAAPAGWPGCGGTRPT